MKAERSPAGLPRAIPTFNRFLAVMRRSVLLSARHSSRRRASSGRQSTTRRRNRAWRLTLALRPTSGGLWSRLRCSGKILVLMRISSRRTSVRFPGSMLRRSSLASSTGWAAESSASSSVSRQSQGSGKAKRSWWLILRAKTCWTSSTRTRRWTRLSLSWHRLRQSAGAS